MEIHDEHEEEFNEKKNWIKDAISNKGSLKKSLGKGKDDKISKSEINAELSKLKAKDKDKKKPGTQLDKKDATKKRRLELAKTLSKLKAVKEHSEEGNYMFFSNLETIKRLVDELLKMDKSEIDAMLTEHDWASDHITSSKDDIEEVFDFIAGHTNPEEETHEVDGTNPMTHLKSFFGHNPEMTKEGLKSMATGMVAALSLLFGSCTWVGIEDKNGNDIENIDYANKTSIGTIKEIERYGKGTLRVQFIDNNGNKIETDMQPSDFWREDTPKAGDSIKLVFDKEGKSAEVYLKDDYNKKSHRHPGGSFWQ